MQSMAPNENCQVFMVDIMFWTSGKNYEETFRALKEMGIGRGKLAWRISNVTQ